MGLPVDAGSLEPDYLGSNPDLDTLQLCDLWQVTSPLCAQVTRG